jgi:uncharacterized protein (TIGR00255 family)
MTGFGQGAVEHAEIRVSVQLRSVNNRYTDLRFRLPQELSDLEPELRRKILETVRRGRVEVSVTVERLDGQEARPVLNRSLLDELAAARQVLANEYGLGGEPDLNTVLSLPGIFRIETPEVVWDDAHRAALVEALGSALAAFDDDRMREGEALAREILRRIERMIGLVGELRNGAADVTARVRDRLLQRLESLRGDVELDPGRVAQEAAFLAERGDVTEEIVRLEGHLSQGRTLIGEPDGKPVGKRMDFLVQEIHRETNTICSKMADLDLTRTALALKAETEKVREQVQNLE